MRKGWTIYTFYTGTTDGHFTSLAAAEREARSVLRDEEVDEIEIEKHEVVPMTKESLIAILNSQGGQWSQASEVVKTIRRRNSN